MKKVRANQPTYPANGSAGMSKRELIAAMAMQGILVGYYKDYDEDAEDIAIAAVLCADALLAELGK